ncbi:hypothetical protein BDQ94DRAFT_139978 [Aspergillus welwitschiae]|uniref:Uncharacterized protein n=1 Tax=Aspergillus welwitschiae TaxID=1341132 RepID=A0A3F3Q926_9EURO|nr:hypothetical protein BDQ94DRAFT_139978 [Aspergillus welwitschiae]RDH35635.1 hypothetical protein BDQ94DRAFT_139978 [Aspergillus welwitschiae]
MSPCFRFDSSPFSYCRQTITPLSNGPTFITLIYCANCPPPDVWPMDKVLSCKAQFSS